MDVVKEMEKAGLPYEIDQPLHMIPGMIGTAGDKVVVLAMTNPAYANDGKTHLFVGYWDEEQAKSIAKALRKRRVVDSVTLLVNVKED